MYSLPRIVRSVWVVALHAFVACSFRTGQAPPDATGAPDAMIDAATDAGTDGAPLDAPADAPPDAPPPPPQVDSIVPTTGSVAGGTLVMITGADFAAGATVTIGGVPCMPVTLVSTTLLTCTTGDSGFAEGAKDVVVENPDGQLATLAAAFTTECPWLTSAGRRSCGAVPPKRQFAPQPVASWVTQFQAGHGFVATGTPSAGDNLDDTTDAVLGTQSAVIETDGTGAARALRRTGLPPIDFTGHVPKLWVKLDNVTAAANLQLWLGDSNLANAYRFSFHSTQGQRWTTEGDWVAFTISWSPANVSVLGTPNRAAITDVQLRVIDNASGTPVRLHVNGIALVPEPAQLYPDGVVSITFDDNFASMIGEGLPVLASHGFPATAYVIVDLVGKPGRTTLAELHMAHGAGWEIAVHAHADVNHAARFTNVPPEVLEDDLVDARAWLIENGFSGYDHCAYPGGAFTGGAGTDVLSLARTYFATCRTIYQGERETFPPADPVKLRVFYVTNTVSLEQAKTAVDQARAHREWIIVVFHNLVTNPTSSTQWSIADFTALVTHIATTGMPVKTIGQVLADGA